MLAILLLTTILQISATGECGVSCPACERRYGCMTESWGKCCVQFYQPNGKRNEPIPRLAGDLPDLKAGNTLVSNLRRSTQRVDRLLRKPKIIKQVS